MRPELWLSQGHLKLLPKKGYRTTSNKSQTTVIGCASAVGRALPLFVIFNGKQLNPLWTRGEIPGTRYGLSAVRDGLIRNCFTAGSRTTFLPMLPFLLLVDEHSSHYSPETIQGVIISLPSTTHYSQSVTLGHFFERYLSLSAQSWKGNLPKFNFMELFSKAQMLTITHCRISKSCLQPKCH